MFEHLNFITNFHAADYSDLNIPVKDREILSELGKYVAEIAHRPIMAERKKLWTDHNALRETRPVILCDPENGWNEIITADDIKCSNFTAQTLGIKIKAILAFLEVERTGIKEHLKDFFRVIT